MFGVTWYMHFRVETDVYHEGGDNRFHRKNATWRHDIGSREASVGLSVMAVNGRVVIATDELERSLRKLSFFFVVSQCAKLKMQRVRSTMNNLGGCCGRKFLKSRTTVNLSRIALTLKSVHCCTSSLCFPVTSTRMQVQ